MSTAAGGRRLERSYFDSLYADDSDPWDFESSDYERDKYAHTLSVLGDRRFERALEVGCSIGVLTHKLASRCDDLVAVDISRAAVHAARERTADLSHVVVEQRSLPEQTPPGPFDLIICSEVLYYWDEHLLGEGLDALTAELASDGLLLAVHWTEPTSEYPLQGVRVHELLRAHPSLRALQGEDRPHYRLDLLVRA